jgi:flagellar biosynthesis protein FlhB
VRTDVDQVQSAVTKAILSTHPSLVVVDDPTFDASPSHVPVLVAQGVTPNARAVRLIAAADDTNGVAAEVARRLARAESKLFRGRRRADAEPAKP